MNDVIQKIKDAADIVELISDHLPLKRSGSSYVGLCPFHSDSKPSMHVSAQKGIFKCFACGAGGDIFKFWSEYHKKDFKETLKDLANKYGIAMDFSPEAQARDKEKNIKIKMHELAAEYYMNKLLASNEAQHCREYLEARAISTATIQKFKLGYSPADPKDWAKLCKYLQEKISSIVEEDIVAAGLANRSEKTGSYFDRFRGRLMIPVCDERGRAIAFGARALKDPSTGEEPNPKYLNSADTDIYIKGNNLYGMHLAKEFIRKEDTVIVVEGYFDLISAFQAGICNIVANQGTALTQNQAKLLTKFSDSKRVHLCFDSDPAGEKATERGVETIMQVTYGIDSEIRIIRIPEGKDLDDFIRSGHINEFKELVKTAPLLIDYEIDKHIKSVDMNSPQSKSKAINQIAKTLRFVKNKVVLTEYVRNIAQRLDIDEIALKTEIRAAINQENRASNPYEKAAPQKPSTSNNNNRKVSGHMIYVEDAIYNTEQEFLTLAILNKTVLEEFLANDHKLITDNHKDILDALIEVSFENPDIDDADIKFQLLTDKLSSRHELSSELADLGLELEQENLKSEVKLRYTDIVRRLRKYELKFEIDKVIAEIKDLERENNQDAQTKWLELQKVKQSLVVQLQKT